MKLYLAPHHDDLLLSLPARLCAATEPMAVAIVFSEEDAALERACDSLHRGLGLAFTALGFREARRRGVSLRDCLRTSAPRADLDPVLLEAVTDKIGELARATGVHELIAPMSEVHLDHAYTRAAAEALAAREAVTAVRYYADQPYATLWEVRRPAGRTPLPPSGWKASRERVSTILQTLARFVGSRDPERILKSYGAAAEIEAEPLWRLDAEPSLV